MAIEWRPKNDPPVIPLVLYAHEDFVREVAFDGVVNTFPTGTGIALVIYPDSDVDSDSIGMWPAVVDNAERTGAWSVDYVAVDALALPDGRGFYRLMMTMPNESDPSNETIERCLALGPLTRK